MSDAYNFPEPRLLSSWQEEMDTMAYHIKQQAAGEAALNILEAGCGSKWGVDLGNTRFKVTGVDTDKDALEHRKNKLGDLDICIHGDLRSVDLKGDAYDVVYNSYVLEHVAGAEAVLDNFMRWLKPGGILVLRIPNRDSVTGFLTRMTPFWFHVLYAKYIRRFKNAGKAGYGPYPTVFDKVVSRRGIHDYCRKHRLVMKAEYFGGLGRKSEQAHMIIEKILGSIISFVTFGRLSRQHIFIYIIEKPQRS